MALLSITASKKVEATVRLEESTAKLVDRYAHFVKASADDVVNKGLEYIFTKDKEFQQHLAGNPSETVPTALRLKRPLPPVTGTRNGTRKSIPAP